MAREARHFVDEAVFIILVEHSQDLRKGTYFCPSTVFFEVLLRGQNSSMLRGRVFCVLADSAIPKKKRQIRVRAGAGPAPRPASTPRQPAPPPRAPEVGVFFFFFFLILGFASSISGSIILY